MFRVHKILCLWVLFCCQAISHDHIILHNNSSEEQKILVLFQSRILLKSNESVLAPHGFSFIIDSKGRRSSISPNLSDFTEFQRKNFDVDVECEIIIPAKTEKRITPPYSLIRKITISNSTHGPISFDWEELYYMGVKTKDDWLGIRKECNLSATSANIIKLFDFSKSHNVLDLAYEKTKEPHLKNPASLIRKVYKKTDEEALQGINYLEKSSLEILKAASGKSSSSTSTSSEPIIPKKTHRMWITDLHTPTEPPLEQLEYYISSVARLNLEEGWSHKFWCWDKSRLPRTCKILENCGQNIQIAEFSHPDELKKIIASQFVFAAIDHGLFTLAGNILRNNILFYEGGFYTDIGAEFKQNPSPLFLHADIVAHHRIGRVDRRAWWIDHDFMAAKAGNFIIRDFLNRINALHELASNTEVVAFFKEPRLEHSWKNARLLTEIFNLFSEAYGIRALILPNDETIIAAHHQTSWYGGDGKSCKDIDKTTLNWFKVAPDYKDLHDSLIVDKFNLELYKKYFAPGLTSPGELTHHFCSQSLGIKAFEGSSVQSLPVTITLTSWPGKIRNAHIAIASLLSQTFKPNKVILWLADDEFPGRKIPKAISQLATRGLEVRWCENIRSAKKLIPSLCDSVLRETLLVVADMILCTDQTGSSCL
ncbi:hypothetical protein [Candidatus Finniella inopinata]|uniref:Uncharacterized protein n=1 Tax=Candidatus Finniella inopinata TaxID=1696036 RepID=A0A4Q7DJA2_9PROT|nr:hypothetical protein [Candidatus Finniella inopinata]RZI46822.1 hypothetical protein EQU50_00945 [Candidatus Finniella inopinata]